MQLQQRVDAAVAELAVFHSHLEAQVGRAAEAEQQHAADLEACKEYVRALSEFAVFHHAGRNYRTCTAFDPPSGVW